MAVDPAQQISELRDYLSSSNAFRNQLLGARAEVDDRLDELRTKVRESEEHLAELVRVISQIETNIADAVDRLLAAETAAHPNPVALDLEN